MKASKLTPAQVADIRWEYSQGATQGDLCRKYGVGVGTIGRIVRGEAWASQSAVGQPLQPELTDDELNAQAARIFNTPLPPKG